ncbi:hypothetical protein BG618_03167 [Pseudonocardia autotrophica]|nr:hypothetical protein BG618_03167 [Pseudonocardia autotrophica]
MSEPGGPAWPARAAGGGALIPKRRIRQHGKMTVVRDHLVEVAASFMHDRSMASQADRDLAIEQFPEMNEDFYRADPEKYLDRRLSALMLTICNSPTTELAINSGLKYKELEMSGSLFHEEDTGAEIEKYAALESTNLLHHASECMLRLYFAHVDQPQCPWLEVARMRTPSQFKERVDALLSELDQPDTHDRLVATFYGTTDSSRLGANVPDDVWEKAKEGLVDLIGYCASLLLDDAGLYNSTKHGLAVIGGNHGISLRMSEEDLEAGEEAPEISTNGAALEHLDQAPSHETGKRRWVKRLRFVRAESNIAITKIVSRYIGTLWGVARFRYTDHGTPFNLALFDREAIVRATTAGLDTEAQYGFDAMSFELAYYLDNDS